MTADVRFFKLLTVNTVLYYCVALCDYCETLAIL